ncbi:MAG TPA: hypothetical protein DCL66_14370 [Gammaproteobacteria bacterium]|nr:hypothetical protein [Gammaproteobacteria bacterium]|tara:strand:+ start:57 stop:386 length:330 start_codon:yes stop_codon:yes gene_type:complete
MFVSITGLKPKGFIGRVRFWLLTIPASSAAQKAEGVLFCEFKTRNGYQQTLTVWETKKHMMAYRASPAHVRAMKATSQIGSGKVFGYETDSIPSWNDALIEFDSKGREV